MKKFIVAIVTLSALFAAPTVVQAAPSTQAALSSSPHAPSDTADAGIVDVKFPPPFFPFPVPMLPGAFRSLTYTMNIEQAQPVQQFFFANQFQYAQAGDVGYFGLQPRDNGPDGAKRLAVQFSSFNADAKPMNTALCAAGADGGAGVTCSRYIPYVPGSQYELTINFTQEDHTFHGQVLNKTTHATYDAGAYQILKESDGISREDLRSWHEDYQATVTKGACDAKHFPYYQVHLEKPRGITAQGTTEIANFEHLALKFQDRCPDSDHSSINPDGTVTWRLGYKPAV